MWSSILGSQTVLFIILSIIIVKGIKSEGFGCFVSKLCYFCHFTFEVLRMQMTSSSTKACNVKVLVDVLLQ